MKKSILSSAIFPLLFFSNPNVAYGTNPEAMAPPNKPEIVVDGAKEQRKTINRYIANIFKEGRENQYARFNAPICPSAIGFTKPVEDFIEQRIREVAIAADIKVGAPDCAVNLHLMIVEDGPEAITALRRKHSQAFGYMTPYERQRLSSKEGPVYDWHLIKVVSVDNGADRSVRRSGIPGGYGLLTDDNANAARATVNSLILLPVRQEIEHAFVLIEKEAIIGLSPVQIADFAAMRALMRLKDATSEELRESSILSIFKYNAPYDEAPELIDDWDFAILKALYSAPDNRSSAQQRSVMARSVEKELIQEP
jgi:hypothetical protein